MGRDSGDGAAPERGGGLLAQHQSVAEQRSGERPAGARGRGWRGSAASVGSDGVGRDSGATARQPGGRGEGGGVGEKNLERMKRIWRKPLKSSRKGPLVPVPATNRDQRPFGRGW